MLAVFERTFNRAMGLWADGQTLWLSSLRNGMDLVRVLLGSARSGQDVPIVQGEIEADSQTGGRSRPAQPCA